MKILFISNYYSPYTSGMTEHVRLVAEEIASRGHSVTVLASNHASLPDQQIVNKVRIIRAPIVCKINKGTVSPAFITLAKKLSKEADVVNLHLPMLESGVIARLVPRNKLFITYHCDMSLPKSFINNLILKIMNASHKKALKRANKIISNTSAYLKASSITNKYIFF